jgi:hypothetical protein
VTTADDDHWLDGDAGRMVRPYAVTGGRTSPSTRLDLLSMVVATGSQARGGIEPDHLQLLSLCEQPSSVAEIAARLRLPAVATKVLVSDLVDCGAVRTSAPSTAADASNRILLERLLDGLQQRL